MEILCLKISKLGVVAAMAGRLSGRLSGSLLQLAIVRGKKLYLNYLVIGSRKASECVCLILPIGYREGYKLGNEVQGDCAM